jgi:hypothetical protein
LKQKQEKDRGIPKQPAGGAAPSGGGKNGKRDLRSSEGRVGAAMQEWEKK